MQRTIPDRQRMRRCRLIHRPNILLCTLAFVVSVGAAAAQPVSPKRSSSSSDTLLPLVAAKPVPALRKAAGARWCWKKPKPIEPQDWLLSHQVVQLERAIVAEILAGRESSGIFEGLDDVGARLANPAAEDVYVVGPVQLDTRGLPPNLHVTTDSFAAAARAFDADSTANVILTAIIIDGYVEDPSGFEGVRATVEINGVFGDRNLSRSYGRLTKYCITSSANGELAIAALPGIRS